MKATIRQFSAGFLLFVGVAAFARITWVRWVDHPEWTDRMIFLHHPLLCLGAAATLLSGMFLLKTPR